MAGFRIFQKLTVAEAILTMIQAETWFQLHPRRKFCQTDLFKIRRGNVVHDVLSHTEKIEGAENVEA